MTVKYSFNQNPEGVVFASQKDINASFKDLGAVCAEIRYKPIGIALDTLEKVENFEKPIVYRKHKRGMGARHELGGKQGRWPGKCAGIVRKVLVNAVANAKNKGLNPDAMYVVHAAANKTMIAGRYPSKGALFIMHVMGMGPARKSDLEFARVEIGIAMLDDRKMHPSMTANIKYTIKGLPKQKKEAAPKQEKKQEKKAIITKTPKTAEPAATKEAPKPVPAEKKEITQPVKQ